MTEPTPPHISRAVNHAHDYTITREDWRDRNRIESLQDAAAMRAAVEILITNRVDMARRHNHSWAEIGEALGISRQAAQQRYGGNESR